MSQVTIYHNPQCSKSRQALELILEQSVEPRVIEYLKTPPTVDELDRLLKMLGMTPQALLRKKEYRGLDLPETTDRDELLRRMVENPHVIQRPIVVAGNKACLGRPPEKVLELLG
ncbi:MAG: arsenate reductase (glutaredoxin) [Pirellulales bacterium]